MDALCNEISDTPTFNLFIIYQALQVTCTGLYTILLLIVPPCPTFKSLSQQRRVFIYLVPHFPPQQGCLCDS